MLYTNNIKLNLTWSKSLRRASCVTYSITQHPQQENPQAAAAYPRVPQEPYTCPAITAKHENYI